MPVRVRPAQPNLVVRRSFNGRTEDSESSDRGSSPWWRAKSVIRSRLTAGRESLNLSIFVRIEAAEPSECGRVVRHYVANVNLTGSSPVVRSKGFRVAYVYRGSS